MTVLWVQQNNTKHYLPAGLSEVEQKHKTDKPYSSHFNLKRVSQWDGQQGSGCKWTFTAEVNFNTVNFYYLYIYRYT